MYNPAGIQLGTHIVDIDEFAEVDWSPDGKKVVGACKNNKGYY